MTEKPNLVLIHGWGLNAAVWQPLLPKLEQVFTLYPLSIPGYGDHIDHHHSDDIDTLAKTLLDQAPPNAIWCGWSLGGMAAMAAASLSPDRIHSMVLLCTTPKFVLSEDWAAGTEFAHFQAFSDDLSAHYKKGLKRFLLLQAGSLNDARNTAKKALGAIETYPSPSAKTLTAGLTILRETDLRARAKTLTPPCTVIAGKRDRVVSPKASQYLADMLPNGSFHALNSGHAPMLSHPDELAAILVNHASQHLDSRQGSAS